MGNDNGEFPISIFPMSWNALQLIFFFSVKVVIEMGGRGAGRVVWCPNTWPQ